MPITDEEIISPDDFAKLSPRERDEYIRRLQMRAEPWELTPKQLEFEACAQECDETLVGGAAGGSKSEWLLWHTIEQCKRFPRFDALVLRSKLPELQRSLIKRSLLRIPPDVATYNTTKRLWEFHKTRSTIEFGYAADIADVQQYLSAEYDLLVIDECTEITDEMYVNLRSRVRTSARKKAKGIRPHTILATNPGGKGHVWVMERFVDPTARGEFTYLDPETQHRIGFVPSFIKDNPHLDEAYERNLRSLPEIRRKQLLEGNWDVFAGQYFTEWDRAVHVVDPFVIPPEWQRAAGYDYGYSNPMAHLSAAFDNDGNCFVYREVYETELTPKQQAGVIKRRSTQTVNGRTIKDEVVSPFADPSIFAKAGGGTGKSIALQFAEAGLPMRKAKNDRKGGWMNLRQYLLIDPNAPHAVTKQPGAPKLYIFSTCVNLVRTLPLQMHDDKDAEDLDTHGEDHACIAEGEPVLTDRGWVPIEKVTTADRVMTRSGWRRVLAVARTGVGREVVRVTADGVSLVCTPDHPVAVGASWADAESLQTHRDTIFVWTNRWWSPKRFRSTAGDGTTGAGSIFSAKASGSIVVSGPTPTALSLTGSTSTTSTGTEPTTGSRTSPFFAEATTSVSTRGNRLPLGLRHVKPRSSVSVQGTPSSRPSSVAPRPRSGGAWLNGSGFIAKSAERFSILRSRLVPASVAGRVKHVPVADVSPAGRADVWNLEVEDLHEFFAGGVLVHNCDALRYLLMNRPIRRVLIEAGPATAEDRVRDKWRKVIAQTKKRKPRGAFDLDRV